MKLFRKILARGTALAITLLYSASAFAQNYVMKTAFVGTPGLKNFVVWKIFDKATEIVHENSATACGFRLTTPQDFVLYKFNEEALNKDELGKAVLSECNVVYMIVDFSSPKTNIKDTLTEDFQKIRRATAGRSKVIIIAMNTDCLSKSDLKQFDYARKTFGKDSFGYILTSSDEGNEVFKEKFFRVTDEMIDWKRLPSLVESNDDIIDRLELLKTIKLHSDNEPVVTLATQVIKRANNEIAIKFHIDDNDKSTKDLQGRTSVLEQDMSAVKQEVDVMKQDIMKLKVSVDELKRFRDEQNKFDEFIQALRELVDVFSKTLTEGATLNLEEVNQILEKINAGMSHLDVASEDSSTDKDDVHNELKKLNKHMVEMKKRICENIEDLNRLKKIEKDFSDCMDKTTTLNEVYIKDRKELAEKIIQVTKIADKIERNEEQLKTISEKTTRDFIWKQYKDEKISWWGKWRLRSSFPFLEELIKQEKEQSKQ